MMQTVVLCADKNIELGVNLTLASMLARATRPLTVYLVTPDFGAPELRRLATTLLPYRKRYDLRVINFQTARFAAFPALVGSHYAYARLLLPDLIPEDRALYLDSDLLVHTDICQLLDHSLEGQPVGAISWETVSEPVDNKFLAGHGLSLGEAHFNSGVLLLDLAQWRQENITQRCLDFAQANAGNLPSHDQSILNVVLNGRIARLPNHYNHPIYGTERPLPRPLPSAIFHFLGPLKPWDLFGAWIHGNYALLYLGLTPQQLAALQPSLWRRIKRAARRIRCYIRPARRAFSRAVPWGTLYVPPINRGEIS
jgi:lipopolysaccharide biosynthesis glycosyltransferase